MSSSMPNANNGSPAIPLAPAVRRSFPRIEITATLPIYHMGAGVACPAAPDTTAPSPLYLMPRGRELPVVSPGTAGIIKGSSEPWSDTTLDPTK